MDRPKDIIARPAKGRYFAHTVPEILALIAEYGLTQEPHLPRVELLFRNADREDTRILSLELRRTLVVFSFEESPPQKQAQVLVRAAMAQFARLDRAERAPMAPNSEVVFRAYAGALGTLTVTRLLRKLTQPKYRGGQKFSHAFQSKTTSMEERVVFEGNVDRGLMLS